MNKIHVALNTNKFDESVAFYRGFFGNEPVKLKPGYAKFELEGPGSTSPSTAARKRRAIQVLSTIQVFR